MNKMKNIRFFLLAAISFLGLSCADDSLNSSELFVYMRNWSSGISVEKTYSDDGSMIIKGVSEIKFPLYLTREASVDVYASVAYDEAQVNSYNQKHGTSLKPFPAAALSVGSNLLIQAGLLQSADSVSVKLDYSNIESGDYLIPLSIQGVTSDDEGIRASVTAGTVFYPLSIEVNNIKARDLEVASGTKIDRTDWGISCSIDPSHVTNLIDGDLESAWQGFRSSTAPIEVDMGKTHTLKSLSFYFKYKTYSYAPQSFTVYTSEDGEAWVKQGVTGNYPFSNTINDKEYGINFFIPVSCRYFRVTANRAIGSYYGPRFNELYAIE